MRTEEVMFSLILGFAKENNSIHAVYMNGSRANLKITKDKFQDYDIVYVVDKIRPFIEKQNWISYFGDLAVMQEPDNSALFNDTADLDEKYTFLMQFKDGNRIDLTFQSISFGQISCLMDSLTILLLDKTSTLPAIPPPSEEDYYIQQPSRNKFEGCCNEYWWVSTYIAKGLGRGELLYALDHLNTYVRPMLLNMLEWYVGIEFDFKVNIGKSSKYLSKYLPSNLYDKLLSTFTPAEVNAIWDGLFTMCELFESTAITVGNKLNYQYNYTQGSNTRQYLESIKYL